MRSKSPKMKPAMADIVKALRLTQFFGGLDDAVLRELAEQCVERHLEKDELLFLAGDEARGMYVIVSGTLRAYRESLDGREQVIHVERAGSTIAEIPVFDDRPYPSNVAAEEPTTVLFIDKRDVRRMILQRPEIGLAALKMLARRLRGCSDLVESLSLRDAGQRLARLILAEARARGTATNEGIAVDLTINNNQIAARVGTVREVVSRSFSRLQHDGLIRMKGRRIVVLDANALALFAGEE